MKTNIKFKKTKVYAATQEKLRNKALTKGVNLLAPETIFLSTDTYFGKNVTIGGQVGISGHLKIGDNVEIAGGSGVIKDISDNSKVMGYPAKNIRDFLRENR